MFRRVVRAVRARAAWLLCCSSLSLAIATPATADSVADDMARRHFESGAAYFEQAEYEEALREFKKAYELSQRPELLVNIANVHERLGRLDEAIEALETFLKAAPESELGETTRIRLDNLRKRRDARPVEPAPSPEPPPAATPSPVPPPTKADPAAPAPAPPPAERPNRLPAYVLFGIAGTAAAGSIVTGLLASSEHSEAERTCGPSCSDGELATGRALAITSTVLTGAAVVAAGVGAVLFFNASSSSSDAANRHTRNQEPTVSLSVSPRTAAATARWRF